MKIIQLLNWKLNTIEKELENIKNQGFDAIQINPIQPFKEESVFHWWSSYQPLGFRIGNRFGTKEDLKHLCEVASEHGIDIIADVVINHMANKSDDEPLIPNENVDEELLSNPEFWKPQVMMHNAEDRWEASNCLIGLPGLKLGNKQLQEIIFRFFDELRDCGVSGLRIDAAKHIGLPNDGVDFFAKTKQYLDLNNMYGYGEFLGGSKDWRDEMAEYIKVLSERGSSLEDIEQLITFWESHDTYLNINHSDPNIVCTRDCDDKTLIEAYRSNREQHDNTLAYVRPIDENNPFCRNKDSLTCEEVAELDEREYFTRVYFDSDEIKVINKAQQQKQIKSDEKIYVKK